MGNRDNRSFNNIRHSNRDKRRQKHRQSRLVLLAMAAVVLLLALVLVIFAICSIVDAIRSRPEKPGENPGPSSTGQVVYTQATLANSQVNAGELVVVNAQHSYPDNVAGLINIYDNRGKIDGSNLYQLTSTRETATFTPLIHQTAFNAFEEMMREHYNIFNEGSVVITSAYRAYKHQSGLSSSIAAGYSDHHTGYTLALKCFENGAQTDLPLTHWLYSNCSKYGFIIRYPGDKEEITGVTDYAHCFRYVGVPHALYITQNGLCLEEYVEVLHGYTADNPLRITDAGRNQNYLVYYVPLGSGDITTLQVPSNYNYTVSGDNVGGFIVTVNLSSPKTAE